MRWATLPRRLAAPGGESDISSGKPCGRPAIGHLLPLVLIPGGDKAAWKFLRCGVALVPKGGFEPPRPNGHYALNVARLPFRHFGAEKTGLVEMRGFEPLTSAMRTQRSPE